jgi:hypothetical protein
MLNFTIEYISLFDELNTNQRVGKLVRNGKCFFDEFIKEIEKDKNLCNEIDNLYAYLEDVVLGKLLSKNVYRKLNTVILKYQPYEVKSKHLRLYLIHDKEKGKVLLIGGKKTTQKEDILRTIRLIKEYSQQ